MILQASQTIVIFESGDIEVGYRAEKRVGEMSFKDIEKQEIGTKVEDNNNVFPVRLIFKNTDSIDVLIKSLNKIKSIMLVEEDKQ